MGYALRSIERGLEMLKITGAFVISTLVLSIPALAVLSFILKWSGFFQLLLVVSTIVADICFASLLYDNSKE